MIWSKARRCWPCGPTTWRSFRTCCHASLRPRRLRRNPSGQRELLRELHLRVVVQRVSRARVVVEGRVTGEIGPGVVVLLGVAREDSAAGAGFRPPHPPPRAKKRKKTQPTP